jgi:DNA modification methylase
MANVILYESFLSKISDIVTYSRNARQHSDEQIAQIVRSITEFGFTSPVLLDENGVLIAGHGRLAAARQLGMVEVPAIAIHGLDEAQKQALRLADNKLALNASWDDELLRTELMDLRDVGFDLGLTGFGEQELVGLFADMNDGLTDPDDVPEPPAEPVTRLGDVWTLGRHRLVCGDATSEAAVVKLMQGAMADLCFTSPPYLRQRDYEGGVGDWDTLMQGVFRALPTHDETQLLVNLGMVHRDGEWLPYWDGWIAWMREQGWRRFGWYVWDQGPGMPGDWNGRLAPSHEWIFHFNRVAEKARKTVPKDEKYVTLNRSVMRRKDGSLPAGPSSPRSGLNTHKIPDSVIRVMRYAHGTAGEKLNHPAVFPVDLVSEMLTAFSDPDDIVYEPFCGSGTQLISAQKNGRTCLAMEIAPIYCDIAVLRWQAFTGQTATRQDGTSFPATSGAKTVQADRGAASANPDDDRLWYASGGNVRMPEDQQADTGEVLPPRAGHRNGGGQHAGGPGALHQLHQEHERAGADLVDQGPHGLEGHQRTGRHANASDDHNRGYS